MTPVEVATREPDASTPLLGSEPPPADSPSVMARALVRAIRGYQLARTGRVTGCRFLPTCSEYAAEAIGTFGAVRGSGLAIRRLSRCTPWGGHGVDPVPDRRIPCTHR